MRKLSAPASGRPIKRGHESSEVMSATVDRAVKKLVQMLSHL